MDYMYQESCGLKSVTPDSVRNFAAKFQSYVNRNPEAKSNPDYYGILGNIESAAKLYNIVLVITINDVWEGDTTIYY